MEILGYIALAIMGVTLGLFGAGGSILTIPILVYLLKVPVIIATRYALAIVGYSAFIGLLRYRHNVVFKKAILFLIPSVLGVLITRRFILPTLVHTFESTYLAKGLIILLVILMAFAGYFMIKNAKINRENSLTKNQNIKVISIALILGIVMSFLGAGGGFLIIPILILLMNFSMQNAIATSLLIIMCNSLIGFAADQHQFTHTDWINLVKYLTPAFLGMLISPYIAQYINTTNLKTAFGYFILIIATGIIIKEFIL